VADSVAAPELEASFGRAARRVRGRLLLRSVLSGVAFGLAAGAVATAGLWWLGRGELRPFGAALGLLGGAVGALLGRRRRWSDEDVALYLDHQLESREQVVTALGLRSQASEAALHLKASAAATIATALPRLRGPKVLDAPQLFAPFGAAALGWLLWLPLPPVDAPEVPPGAERVQSREVKGLERIEALRDLRGRSPEDERRLRALAEEARKLRRDLEQGVEKRDALLRMAKLRDAIAELRSELGSEHNRPGLEAAIAALEKAPGLGDAARALGDGDLTEFDREMQRLANQAEQAARESARAALKEAERAAREKGASLLGDALKEQQQTLAEREANAEALRQLGEALKSGLDPQALEDLRELGESGDPEAARRLARSMGQALSKLSAEERERLAEQLKQEIGRSAEGSMTPMTREELQELARRLASPEGQRELQEHLRQLADPARGREAQREGALDDAERGLGAAERGLGPLPLPMPGTGTREPLGAQTGQDPSAQGSGDGRSKPTGETQRVPAPELRAKADVQRSGAGPMHAATLGRAPARPGDTANQRGTGSLGSVAPAEIGAIEQSEVPEEYREHVGRYFEP
jgi:hypothetical protein